MNYLMYQLCGSKQSWGMPCQGRIRHTYDHPSKSGLFGMVGASLGIDFSESEKLVELNNTVGYACREDVQGNLKFDYQIVGVNNGKKRETVPTERYFLSEAIFTICLWKTSQNGPTLESIENALNYSGFSPYLGRKNFELNLPFAPKIVDEPDLKNAFSKYVADEHGFLISNRSKKCRVFWEGNDNSISKIRDAILFDSLIAAPRVFSKRIEHEGRVSC